MRIFAVVDLVSGVACIALAPRISQWSGVAGKSISMITGAVLIAIGLAGSLTATARRTQLVRNVQLLAAINIGFALLLVGVGAAASPNRQGVIALLILAISCVALGVTEARLVRL